MNTRGCSVFGVGVSQVQKVYRQNSVFSSLIPGRRYHFVVRTEKESFTDSSPVTINITAGTHTHTHTNVHTQTFIIYCIISFINTAPSSVEVSVLNKTTSSICISWSTIRGVVSGFALSITNATSSQELIVSQEGHRSILPLFHFMRIGQKNT